MEFLKSESSPAGEMDLQLDRLRWESYSQLIKFISSINEFERSNILREDRLTFFEKNLTIWSVEYCRDNRVRFILGKIFKSPSI